MLATYLRRLSDPASRRGGPRLLRLGLRPNAIATLGFVLGLGAIPAIASHLYILGFVLIVLNRACDAMEDSISQSRPASTLGHFLNLTFGPIVFAGVAFAFALAMPASALAAGYAIFAMLASTVSGLAITAVIEGKGALAGPHGYTALGYMARLMEESELFVGFSIACFAPDWFAPIAYIVGVLCFLTAGARIAIAAVRFSGS